MPDAITDTLKIALAQLNPTVGDLAANADKLRKARARAAAEGADLVVSPELLAFVERAFVEEFLLTANGRGR